MYSIPLDQDQITAGKLLGRLLDLNSEQTQRLLQCARWVRLKRAERLFEEGAHSHALYFLISGRLRGHRGGSQHLKQVVEFYPGDVVGELGFFDESHRTLTVSALKDSVLIEIDRTGFSELGDLTQPLMLYFTKTLVGRLKKQSGYTAERKQDLHVLVHCVTPMPSAIREQFEQFQQRFCEQVTFWFFPQSDVDEKTVMGLVDKVLVWADSKELAISRVQRRCKDIFNQYPTEVEKWLAIFHANGDRIEQTSELCHSINTDEYCHIRSHHQVQDLGRLMRRLSHLSVGLVLGGGGARGFAHAGVYRAFEEAGLCIDSVGGTSMGALVGGLISMGRGHTFVEKMLSISFPNGLPFSFRDYTVPKSGFIRGASADRVYKDAFGTERIENLPIPFFAVCCNLSSGAQVVLNHGLLWQAIRMTTSIPVLFEPWLNNGAVMVDGALLNNLPAQLMTSMGVRHLISVDVGVQEDVSQSNSLPSIVQTLMRITELAGLDQAKSALPISDIFIQPKIDDIGLLDFNRRQDVIDRGYQAGIEALDVIRAKGLL